MTTPRLTDWQARFGALVEDRRLAPFSWGPNDCCSFAADAVQACTGTDPIAEHRGYTDAIGASRTLRTFGDVGAVGDALFGAVVAPGLARVGDVGLVTFDDRPTLAVCNGETWLAPGPAGLVAVPLSAATRAWRF